MHAPQRAKKTPPRVVRPECCTDDACGPGLKNRYYKGKKLTPDSFQVEQRYLVERRRLLNRAIHGWGVVYGYGVDEPEAGSRSTDARLVIQPGLALDECGRELLQSDAISLELGALLVLDKDGKRVPELKVGCGSGHRKATCWLLSAHYAEQDLGPVTVTDPCRCDHKDWDQTCETVRYSLQPIDCEECCREQGCELYCECEPCCGPNAKSSKGDDVCACQRGRGGRCLCKHLIGLKIGEACNTLCEVEEPCARVRVDLYHGVPLACFVLDEDGCGRAVVCKVDACGPRRLVKRNDVLFDLMRGCDLTRIAAIGWQEFHRSRERIPFGKFAQAIEATSFDTQPGFWIEFSRPVLVASLLPDAFAMTVMSVERKEGWWTMARVPIVEMKPDVTACDPRYAQRVRLVFESGWVQDAVRGEWSGFLDRESRIEVEIRGDFIVDCNGTPVDANAVGLTPVLTGNGTPGGTFLSTFCIEPRESIVKSRYASTKPSEGA